jgi:hypothetical protein
MSVRNFAFFNLLLCGFLALTGCKSPNWFGFADRTATAPETQLAATTVHPPDNPSPTRSEPTATELSAHRSSWRKATGWLTLRRTPQASAEERLATDRALERQLSNKAIQPQAPPYSRGPAYPAEGTYTSTSQHPVSPAEETLMRSTPSLVRLLNCSKTNFWPARLLHKTLR